jgi:hypothetical protein
MKVLRRFLLLGLVSGALVGNTQNWLDSLPLIKSQTQDTIIAVTHAFHVYTRRFQPVDTVFVRWDHAKSRFLIYGEATSPLEQTTLHFNFGTHDSSYFQIHGNFSRSIYTPNLVDTFTVAGLRFSSKPTETQFTHDLDENQSSEYIYGDVSTYLDGHWIDSRLGSFEAPGIQLVNGMPDEIFVQLLDRIFLRGLPSDDIDQQDILLKRHSTDPPNTYYGHGTWAVLIAESVQIATLGSSAEPGVVIKNGIVDSVKMTVAGGGILFGALPITDVFTMTYLHAKSKYAISGMLKIGIPLGGLVKAIGKKNIPEFEIDAGDETHSGFLLNVNTGTFTVEDAVFQMRKVDLASKLGGLEINNVSLQIQNNLPDSIYARVTLPGRVSVQCALAFNLNLAANPLERFHVHSILIAFEATGTAQGIAMGDTGMFLVKIQGGVSNLDNIDDLTLIADVGVTLGKPFKFKLSHLLKPPSDVNESSGGTEMVPGYMEGGIELSLKGVKLSATALVYAYFSQGLWKGIFGEMDLTIDLIFGHSYNVIGNMYTPAPPHDIIVASLIAHFNQSGDIDAQGSVRLQIPKEIPIIGGKTLAKAEGVLRHKQGSPHESYIAGWAKINFIGRHIFAGVKVKFDNGAVSKIGSGQARELKSEVTSDESQHPASDGQVNTTWHACEITNTFTIDPHKPPAYLQNELIFDKRVFADPQHTNTYFSTVSANIEPSSGTDDLKSLLPEDSLGLFYNNGQTTRPYHAVIIDLSKSNTHSHTDTIRWITENHVGNAYNSIDWKNRPDLLLTPGQQVLTVAGYCPSGQAGLNADSFHLDISPVYPEPEVSLSVNPLNRALTIDYSAYLTDSTVVSVYWNGNKQYSGRPIAHLNHGQGTPIGDSTYRWVIDNWDPGILPQKQIYLYAVIDDFVNPPVYTPFDSTSFDQFITGTVEGGTDSTLIILKPVDTSRHDVKAILQSSTQPAGVSFGFYNVPLGEYNLYCMNNDPVRSLYTAIVWNLDGHITGRYHSEEWVSIDFTVNAWGKGEILNFEFNTIEESVKLFGNVTDHIGQSVGGYTIFLLDHKDSVIQTLRTSDLGYIATNLSPGYVNLAVKLHEGNYQHWPRTVKQKYFNAGLLYGLALYMDSISISEISKEVSFKAISSPQGPVFLATDENGHPVHRVMFSLEEPNGTGRSLYTFTNRQGLALLDESEIKKDMPYILKISWPKHFTGITPNGQQFKWIGGAIDPWVALGKIK